MPRTYPAVAVFVLSASMACSVQTPLAPTPGPGSSEKSAPDGTTLKVGAPTLVSPIGDTIIASTQQVTLTIADAAAQFKTQAFNYDFGFKPTVAPSSSREVRPALPLPFPQR
jgi:hypothetical protein